MIFVRFVLMFSPTEVAFWLVMQLGLIIGFLTTYPAMLCLADTAGHQGGRVSMLSPVS